MRRSWVIDTATLLLPRGDVRQRYREELDGELRALAPSARWRFLLGVVASAWALRRAVRAPETADAEPTPLLCRLEIHHDYHRFSTEDGQLYRRCTRCGQDDPHLGHNQLPVTPTEP